MKNILVISGHPELTHSVANATILDEVETALPDVEIRRLDRLYPDGKFNIAAEQESLLRADVIVWQFPFSWYGLPGLMKKWLYSGWPNAMSAVSVTKAVFETRGVTPDALPDASPDLLPLNQEAEKQRSETVEKNVGRISPGLVKFTADPLFLDLWQRPALTPRDRSLITVSALIASGQSAQIGYHLNRAMDNGLSAEEAGEIVTQAAFYAGWPNAFTAAPVVGEVLINRSSSKT